MKLSKFWTKVTPLSKTIAFILFVGLPILGFYLGMQYQYSIDMYDQYTQASLNIPVHRATTTITLQQAQKTIYVKEGDIVVLNLGDAFKWGEPTVTPTGVLQSTTAVTSVAHPTAIYKAIAPGTVHLTTMGTPICKKGQICSQMRIAINFATTVIVEK